MKELAQHNDLLGLLRRSYKGISERDFTEPFNNFDKLVDLGLNSIVFCSGGIISSSDVTYIALKNNIATAFFVGGLTKVESLSKTDESLFKRVTRKLNDLDVVVSLLDKVQFEQEFPNLYYKLTNVSYAKGRRDAFNIVANAYLGDSWQEIF